MKKAAALSTVFLFVFGLTVGIVTVFNEDAMAIWQCSFLCEFENDCSNDTGPECSGNTPYYAYRVSTCVGGPLNCPYTKIHIGCWSGEGDCIIKIIGRL